MRKLYLLLFILLATACSQDVLLDDYPSSEIRSTKFVITNSVDEVQDGVTKASQQPIGNLIYAIFDSNNRLVHPAHQLIGPNFTSLTVEGLRDGNYSIVFLGATDASAPILISELTEKGQKWIENASKTDPIGNDYIYNIQPFSVGPNNSSREVTVKLRRSVGKVKVEINAANDYSRMYITKVEISYNSNSPVASYQLADGSYGGETVISNFDITNTLGFYSLPSTKKLSGKVRITATRSDKSIFVNTYLFDNTDVVAGKESVVKINWTHPEDRMGKFNVRAQDLNSSNSMIMFLPNESRDVLVSADRSFNVNNPLQISVDANHKLCVRFFSAIPISDVTILCQFPKISNEFFEMVHYEQIPAFLESKMAIPVVSGDAMFKSADGRLVEIPAQPDLSNNDCRFKIVTNDPYMKKIEAIVPKWFIYFWHYDAATAPNSSWKFMTPEFCRQGVVLTTNMAYMFSSKEFKDMLDSYSGQLKDDARKPIPDGEIINRINAKGALRMGLVEGVQGLGGGDTYGIASYRYRDHYWDYAPRNEIRTTQFHEFSHTIGYGHESDMTYGSGLWNVICSQLMWDMGHDGKLVVNTKRVLNP